ncbi:MAG TPA: flagellar export protein FliJ [Mycobacteriales bacterium]|nr:flagellar export protein FliJ [Mycobacteriales bacterium]
MKRGFRLASVLRVRRVQEEVARAEVAKANRTVGEAWTDVERRAAYLDSRRHRGFTTGTSAAFIGSLTAGIARAQDLSAARAAHQLAQQSAAERAAAWSETAQRVKALESLEERHRTEVRAADEAAAQRASDDRSGAVVAARLRGVSE